MLCIVCIKAKLTCTAAKYKRLGPLKVACHDSGVVLILQAK